MNSNLLEFRPMVGAPQIRREKLLELIAEYGNIERVAALADQSASYLSQVKNQTRNMGNRVARSIEMGLGLPEGWMDIADSPPATDLVSQELLYFRRLTREQREAIVVILEAMVDARP